MRWNTRSRSGNIEDRRAYFGGGSVDPGYSDEDRYQNFLNESLLSPYLSAAPQTFRQDVGLTIEDLLALLANEKAGGIGKRGVYDPIKAGILLP